MKGDVNMVSTSKILTVSYGTFSCTLEGFDDSFETMKAIAEYFRDLAADDRYFGAEPPTPDAEMLARIAEREIARRVEAREEKGGIVLRASDAAKHATPALGAATADAAAQPAETPEPSAEPQADTAEAPAEAAPVMEEAPAEAAPILETEDAPEAIEPATEEAEAPEAAEIDEAEPEPQAEPDMPEAEEAQAEAEEMEEAPAEAETPVEEVAEETVVAEAAEDTVVEEAAAEKIEEVEAEEIAPAAAQADDNSIAAKLQRIRAVVSRNTTEVTDYSEDQHADAFVEPEMASLDAVLSEETEEEAAAEFVEDEDGGIADIMAETRPEEIDADEEAEAEDLVDQSIESEPETAEEEALDTLEAELQALVEETPEVMEEAEEEASAEVDEALTLEPESRVEDEEEDDVASILDKLAGLSDDEPAEAPVFDEAEDEDVPVAKDAPVTEDDLEAFLSGLSSESEEDSAEPEAEVAEVAEEPAPLRARVLKMKRADFEEAIAQGHLEESDEDDDAWDDDWNALDDTDLSPEEEAELQAELAEVEAELDEDDADTLDLDDDAEGEIDSIFAETEDDTPDLQDRRRARDQLDEAASESDMSRLMAKTISEMDEPESANRRSAIQHLRAAVAATRADKEAGISNRPDTIGEAFREDLASVVRPRRPRTEGSGTARPTEPTRPAPLKLVAEQRIDAPSAPQAPVRPRRVSMSEIRDEQHEDVHAAQDSEGFADYAETMGAHDLPEILEAAAAYLSFVEGRDQFSRPQLMTRARAVIGDEFSREDGLRSFGQLLRQGKIQKLKGGRFTVSEDIGFQPGARRVG